MKHPLKNIAISFSGGGYRAAAYNLGVLSYLNHLKLGESPVLEKVKMISTISGGTIAGIKYAQMLAHGKTFNEFFGELYDFLKRDFIMDEAFKRLNTAGNWDYESKSKNLINVFAEIYQQNLLNNDTFKLILDYSDRTGMDFMFNATDLQSAKPFRFQTRGRIGNKFNNVPIETANDLKLGDILAASSCFPFGFEPLNFPDDFIYSSTQKNQFSRIELMDGGIVDNQGIESIWLADKGDKGDVGTYIISDVASNGDSKSQPKVSKKGVLFKLGSFSLNFYLWLFAIVFIVAFAALFVVHSKWALVLSSSMLTITGLALFAFFKIQQMVRKTLKSLLNQNTPKLINDFKVIRKISLNQLFQLLKLRVNSVVKLNLTVFLTRLRQLHYDATYEDTKWNTRTVSNMIYDLPKIKNDLTSALATRIENANNMGTTLWFSDEQKKSNQMLNDLIICGQATICQNLTTHLERRLKDENNPLENPIIIEIASVVEQLKADFVRFNEKPEWLLKTQID